MSSNESSKGRTSRALIALGAWPRWPRALAAPAGAATGQGTAAIVARRATPKAAPSAARA